MISIQVRLYAIFSQVTGSRHVELELPAPATLAQILEHLLTAYPNLGSQLFDPHGNLPSHVQVFLNGRDLRYLEHGVQTQVNSGDTVSIFPAIGGGSGMLSLESDRVSGQPGGSIPVVIWVANPSTEELDLELSVSGIPAHWLLLPPATFHLEALEKRELILTIEPPLLPEGKAGVYPFQVRLINRQNPQLSEQVQSQLVITGVSEKIGLKIEVRELLVAPGSSAGVNVRLLNQTGRIDQFKISVDGIADEWLLIPTTPVNLDAGEERTILVSFRPPRAQQNLAGNYPFVIRATSLSDPLQLAAVEGRLLLSGFAEMLSQVDPDNLEIGQVGKVTIRNLGNIEDHYTITWQGEGSQIDFQPAQQQEIRLPAGETAIVEFSATPHRRPLLGGVASYAFTTRVEAGQGAVQVHRGRVTTRGLMPVLVFPILLVLCLGLAVLAFFYIRGSQPPASLSATGTAQANQNAQATQAAATTATLITRQTAAAALSAQDQDGDGLNNREEDQLGTDASRADTDQDGLLDGDEVRRVLTDPRDPDSDDDLLKDGEEVLQYNTDPRNPDSDGDGLTDGQEIQLESDPRNPDSDGDALSDGEEFNRGTDLLDVDTDTDGLNDGMEVDLGTDPLQADSDRDGLNDSQEKAPCPDPLNPDTDGDRLLDSFDLDPCDSANPSITATALAIIPSPTSTIATPTPFGPTPTPSPPALPGVLLFETNRDGNPEIYSSPGGTRSVTRLTNHPGTDSQPAWSSDKSFIAFVSNRDGNNDIFRMNSDGSNLTNLTDHPANDQYPAWSPDGQWIAFTSDRNDNPDIYLMQSDGTYLENLTNHLAADYAPNWLPDGRILFTSNREGNLDVYVMNPDGSGLVNLTENPADDYLPATAPGGDRIAFTSTRDGNPDIFWMNLDGSQATNLSRAAASDQDPTWSPDGTWIAFVSNRDGNQDIYVIRLDGSLLYNYTGHPANDQAPAWR